MSVSEAPSVNGEVDKRSFVSPLALLSPVTFQPGHLISSFANRYAAVCGSYVHIMTEGFELGRGDVLVRGYSGWCPRASGNGHVGRMLGRSGRM
jgi:hypothetical protein